MEDSRQKEIVALDRAKPTDLDRKDHHPHSKRKGPSYMPALWVKRRLFLGGKGAPTSPKLPALTGRGGTSRLFEGPR